VPFPSPPSHLGTGSWRECLPSSSSRRLPSPAMCSSVAASTCAKSPTGAKAEAAASTAPCCCFLETIV
jgi:hypothetical protein